MLHIYIISLKQDIEKREVISKTLKNFGLDFSFVDAIYGKDLPDSSLSSFRNKSTGKIINRGFSATPGEIGCTLSHLKAYQEIIDRGLEWACILEDDAILDERFKTFIEEFDDSCLDLNNLYLLGGQTPNSKRHIIKSTKNVKSIGFQRFYKTIKSTNIIYRTCCYLISSDISKKFISLAEDEFILADDWAYLEKKGLVKRFYLSDFVEHPIELSDSTIQKERDNAALKVKKAGNMNLRRQIKVFISPRLRMLALNVYRYVEPRDK